jgi:hypothetical protein
MMNTELRFADGYRRAKLNGTPVIVKVDLATSEAYIWFPQKRIEDAYGNISYQNDILGAKQAHRMGLHLEFIK